MGSRAALAERLDEGPPALVVIGAAAGADGAAPGQGIAPEVSCAPYLRLAVRAGAPAVVLLDGGTRESAAALIRAGARGALREDVPAHSLAAAMDAVRTGLIVLDPEAVFIAGDLHPEDPGEGDLPAALPRRSLTPRERQVLSLIATGASNKAIARRLGVSSNTVKFHLAAVFAKLGVATRAEAVAEGIRRGALSL